RATIFVNSFINGIEWAEEVGSINRKCSLTKDDIVKFANEYLKDDNYVYVYKRQGIDPNIKRIEKPAITPVESNRDAESEYIKAIRATDVAPIEPIFVDFDKSVQKLTADKDIPVVYVKNVTNRLFSLTYRYEMGLFADNVLPFAADYINYIGTSDMSAEEIQKEFYALGCNFRINCEEERFSISISGLNENLSKAVALLDKVLNDAQPNDENFAKLVESVKKNRADKKTNQGSNYNQLVTYAMYGPEYINNTVVSNTKLSELKASDLTDRLHNLKNYKHQVHYYGPSDETEVVKICNENRILAEALTDVPANKKYDILPTTENVTYLAPYVANNIYLTQVCNLGGTYDPDTEVGRSIYNEYFGGSMNGVVFQEMRETRGLAYSARATLAQLGKKDDPYYFTTMIATQNDKLKEALSHFNEIIENMPESEAAFNNAKSALISRLRTQRTFGQRILSSYLSAQDCGISEDPRKNIYDGIQNFSLADLVAYQQKMIKGRKYSICVLGDKKQLDLEPLKAMGTIKEIQTEDIFGY
ncbi:MAG: insulinase family protein, partial [Bacteroidales bacterium]|nr:insulinase family protein [Bacteroidales bacterium]